MTVFTLTAEITAILRHPDFAPWLLENVRHSAAPGFDENGRLCLQFEDDEDAQRFSERWLAGSP